MCTYSLLSCLPRFLFRPIAVVLLPSLLFASCGSPGRIVMVHPTDSAPVRGRLIAVHDDCAIIDTTCDMLPDLKLLNGSHEWLLRERAAAWRTLAGQSVRIDTARMDSVYLEGEHYVGGALLAALGITALAAGLGALSAADDNHRSWEPWAGAAINASIIGIPAILISLIAGIASSHGEATLRPGDPAFIDDIKEAAAVSSPLPAEADSLDCDNDLR